MASHDVADDANPINQNDTQVRPCMCLVERGLLSEYQLIEEVIKYGEETVGITDD